MRFLRSFTTLASALLLLASGPRVAAQQPGATATPSKKTRWSKREEPMVEVNKVCRGIFVELRYATTRNFVRRQIYPTAARCLLRKSVAERLSRALEELRPQGFSLKIWDAYRPRWAHAMLWETTPNPEYVASPQHGGSWHSWGAAVDVTLVDLEGREQPMPTDFDDFTAAAKSIYQGFDPVIAANVLRLRTAMRNAGFKGIHDEWWHFTALDANQFLPVEMPLEKGGKY